MRYGTPKIAALARSLELLEAIIADGGAASTLEHALRMDMPHSTTHRIVRTLVATGFLAETSRGRHVAGARLQALLREVSQRHVLAAISRPILRAGAAKLHCVAHLGILQDGMVTYLVREGLVEGGVFTREGSQLEAYCSALGKILLTHLPPDARNAYLASGPFVALTAATITDPDLIRNELDRVSEAGIAWDQEEIAPGLICCAAPVVWPAPTVSAAVSLSFDKETYLALGRTTIVRSVAGLAKRVTRAATGLVDPLC